MKIYLTHTDTPIYDRVQYWRDGFALTHSEDSAWTLNIGTVEQPLIDLTDLFLGRRSCTYTSRVIYYEYNVFYNSIRPSHYNLVGRTRNTMCLIRVYVRMYVEYPFVPIIEPLVRLWALCSIRIYNSRRRTDIHSFVDGRIETIVFILLSRCCFFLAWSKFSFPDDI